MNMLDLAIVAIVLVSLLVGLVRGFVREVLSLAAWIVALWAAYGYARLGGTYLVDYIDQPPVRVVAAFAIIFVVVLIVASFLGYLLCRLFSVGGLDGLDRSLGMLFGIGRGVLVVAILILVAIFMDMTPQPWWQKSLLASYFDPVVELLRSLMPPDLAGYFQTKDGLG